MPPNPPKALLDPPPIPPRPIMAAILAASNMALEDDWEEGLEEGLDQLPLPPWALQPLPPDCPPPPPPLLEKWGLGSQEGFPEDWPVSKNRKRLFFVCCLVSCSRILYKFHIKTKSFGTFFKHQMTGVSFYVCSWICRLLTLVKIQKQWNDF